uniref:Slingshot protein phosphatase 3 n=1 Tax=Homo sapiens TaxID=9606 RepID=E9PMS1_HUMAN
MALVTVSRSPPGSGASTPVGPWAELCGAPWGCPGTAGWRGQ